jgi:hypothetical protein
VDGKGELSCGVAKKQKAKKAFLHAGLTFSFAQTVSGLPPPGNLPEASISAVANCMQSVHA